MANKYVYFFGANASEGNGTQKNLLGGKGANLAEMARRGFNVPPGFTITTEVCVEYYKNGKKFPKDVQPQVNAAVAKLEKTLGKKFGDKKNPLLVAVRSGARESMPGMMDTILNLGLNDETVEALKAATNNGKFAYDCYRRFIQMYGDVVMGVQKKHENEEEPFEGVLHGLKHEVGVTFDNELSEDQLKELIKRYKVLVKKFTGKNFPADPREQLQGAITAVMASWMNERAILYRAKYRIPEEWGTAVNVQSMVFGNMGDDSATGVAFTRDPATGENIFYGEYLVNAQGEDVVAGVRTPLKIVDMAKDKNWANSYKELEAVRKKLEKEFGEVQDFEFTIEKKKLFMLQTRNGKRTALAYVKIAHDMVKEGLMSPERAVESGDPEALNQLLQPIFDTESYKKAQTNGSLLTVGLPAGPGAATGVLAFSAAEAERQNALGKRVVLARIETSPEDLRGMIASQGILTARGGVSSHAALVARQMGKVCVAGAGEVEINYEKALLTCKGKTIREGESIAINGSTGEVFAGEIKTSPSELLQVLVTKTLDPKNSKLFQYYDFVMKLADKYRVLGIRTNADQPDQASVAVAFGAEGVGLCRTEHMFFDGDRIDSVREMILFAEEHAKYKELLAEANGDEDKVRALQTEYGDAIKHFNGALAKLLPIQQKDFEGLFTAMAGRPVTVRYLDPPLHEFLPASKDQKDDLAKKLGVSYDRIEALGHALHEANPMLGHRGCRLGIVYPEISEMQSRAIFRAALAVAKKTGKKVMPEIMIPLVGFEKELEMQLAIVHRVAAEEFKAAGTKLPYLVGTMVEIPRAALTASEIAKHAQFFSFGTNDLTQTTLGMSRDDAGKFLPHYQKVEIVKANPFASIDQTGVGRLMEIAIEGGRKTRPDIKLGICGEHGGEPHSVKFCHDIGLKYVSCSPYRVPVARLAAGQAGLAAQKKAKASAATAKAPVAKKAVKAAKPAAKKVAAKAPVKAAKAAPAKKAPAKVVAKKSVKKVAKKK
ncbi:MAG TPA: pyruvate, phosphate dikinase [Fibrobacteria bacterium]|nr:pyruvate, phosphate dikinase [Fibrobacteria bacterium]HOX50512.1 pyruvate, phosphate dikinase [Fibrobacteria bacterium]